MKIRLLTHRCLSLAFLVVLVCSPVTASAQDRSLRHLKTWANELPVRGVGVKRRSIFDDPGLRAALIKLMGAAEFTRMVAHFEATVSANVVNGFLILTGWPDHDAPHAYLVIVNLDSGDVWAARQGESAVQWYGERVPSRAPDCLIADFLARKQEMY